MKRDTAIDTLLDLNGSILDQGDGYWIKVEAWQVEVSKEIPHGVRYSLTLHEPYGKRILGYDNAHAVKPPKKFKSDASWPMTTSTGTSRIKVFPTNSRMRTC